MVEQSQTTPRPLLLVCDLDRTVVPNGPHPEAPSSRPAFRRVVASPSVTLVYATGRDAARVRQAIDRWDLPNPAFVIADVGATLYRCDAEPWAVDTGWSQTLQSEWSEATWRSLVQLLAPIPGLRPQENDRMSRFKCSFYTAPASLADTAAHVATRLTDNGLRCRLITSVDSERSLGLIDVLPASASKLGALRVVQERTGLHDADTVFAGDSGNDLDVLASSVPSVLVGNASAEVAATARSLARDHGTTDRLYVVRDDDETGFYSGGILAGLRHFRPDHIPEVCA